MSHAIDPYRISEEPFYQPQADEVELYEAAYAERLPVMIKGPTGCGKSRFVERRKGSEEKGQVLQSNIFPAIARRKGENGPVLLDCKTPFLTKNTAIS